MTGDCCVFKFLCVVRTENISWVFIELSYKEFQSKVDLILKCRHFRRQHSMKIEICEKLKLASISLLKLLYNLNVV